MSRTKRFPEVTDELIRYVCSHLVESSEAAQIVGITQTSISRYVNSEKLFGVRVGGALLLRRSEVEKCEKRKPGRPAMKF